MEWVHQMLEYNVKGGKVSVHRPQLYHKSSCFVRLSYSNMRGTLMRCATQCNVQLEMQLIGSAAMAYKQASILTTAVTACALTQNACFDAVSR
jgi:hypothetical protein